MHEIAPIEVTPHIRALFPRDVPTILRALCVMAGGNDGRILVDDADPPRYAFVWEADDGGLYPGGDWSRATLSEAMARLRSERLVALGFRAGDPCTEQFPPDPSAGVDVLEYDRPLGASDLSALLGPLPPGYEVRRMDETLWRRSPRRTEEHDRYGSMGNFLARAMACCITCGDETASEAYADMAIDGVREIGIYTEEKHRKRGLGTIACAQLIQWCEQEGSATHWDCVATNEPSIALAHKLGFCNERPYKLLAWFGPSFHRRVTP